jgi:hypothetical protein
MEVVSPLAFVPTVAGAGSKRGFIASYSPSQFQMETAGGCGAVTTTAAAAAAPLSEEDALLQQRSAKRRRFHHADTSVDSLSNAFGSPSAFFQSKMGGPNHHGKLLVITTRQNVHSSVFGQNCYVKCLLGEWRFRNGIPSE